MKKGLKIAIFVVAASAANIAMTVAVFFACLGLNSLTLARLLPQTAVVWAVVASFVLSLAGAFLLYKKLLGLAEKKFRLSEKLGLSGRRRTS